MALLPFGAEGALEFLFTLINLTKIAQVSSADYTENSSKCDTE